METNEIIMFAHAKINLGLAVLGKRPDGYHELQSVMQSIALHDKLKITLESSGIECLCGDISGPNNLSYQAAKAFLEGINSDNGVKIEIDKKIPVQAGLAGGSSDAAATLRALNKLFNNPYSLKELYQIAQTLGSDVAFCLEGGTQWATGVGEILEDLPTAPRMDLIIVKPQEGISTAEAYRVFDYEGRSNPLNQKAWREALATGNKANLIPLLSNDLEQASMRILPVIKELKTNLIEKGCLTALMSGSGSAVFGIAESQAKAREIGKDFENMGYQVWVTHTIERGENNWAEKS